MEIRKNKLVREKGMELVKKFEGKIPEQYLDEYLKDFEITRDDFIKCVDKFANKDLFKTDANGNLIRDENENIEKTYENIDNIIKKETEIEFDEMNNANTKYNEKVNRNIMFTYR